MGEIDGGNKTTVQYEYTHTCTASMADRQSKNRVVHIIVRLWGVVRVWDTTVPHVTCNTTKLCSPLPVHKHCCFRKYPKSQCENDNGMISS